MQDQPRIYPVELTKLPFPVWWSILVVELFNHIDKEYDCNPTVNGVIEAPICKLQLDPCGNSSTFSVIDDGVTSH